MDPIALATLTSAITTLATEVGKGVASEAGKDTWKKIKSAFGWTGKEKRLDELAPSIAKQLIETDELAEKIIALLKGHSDHNEASGQLVGSLTVEAGGKVIVAEFVNTINM